VYLTLNNISIHVLIKENITIRFKYRFGPQPLAFVSNWSLTFQLCQIGPQPINLVSKWSLPLNVGWKLLTWLTVYF
jgi:hypothetical protein